MTKEERMRWVPFTGNPSRLVPLQSALGQIVEKESGTEFVEFDLKSDWCDPARVEVYNMWYGGKVDELGPKLLPDRFTKRIEMPEALKAELAMAEGTHTAAWASARSRAKKCLAADQLRLIRVLKRDPRESAVNPLVIEDCLPGLWQSSDPDDVVLQQLILGRKEHFDGKWWYAVDKVVLMSLLAIDLSIDESKHPSCVATGAPEPSVPIRLATEGLARSPGRPGRKKGSGTKPDNPSLSAMLDLLADDKASSASAAAKSVVEQTGLPAGNNETSTQSRIDRLRHKFAEKYGTAPPPGKTWDDVRKAGGV